MAEPNNTPRPLSPVALATETTPLLSGGESSTQQEGAEQTAPLPLSDAENVEPSISTSRTFRFIKLTTYCSLISSIICLILFLAAYITSEMSPFGSYNWRAKDTIVQLGIFILFSTAISILNLSTTLHPYPQPSATDTSPVSRPRTAYFYLPLTLFIDIIFVLFIWSLAGRLSSEASLPNYCKWIMDPDSSSDMEICQRWRLALRILCVESVCMSVVVGLAHLVLFVLRCITAFRSGLWSHPIPWNFPMSGITVQFTVKLLGQERANGN